MLYAQAIQTEVDHLNECSMRLEKLAEDHPPVAEPLTTIAGSVRNTAILLAIVVATKGPKPS